jgi:hypothetical protein
MNHPSPTASVTAPNPTDARPKPTKKLPTFRAGLPKQLDSLRAYALLSEGGTKPVHYGRVADMIKMHEANVSSMNPFFVENGFLEKNGPGYAPAPAVLEYARQHKWNPEAATQKLAPIVINTWFGQALSQRLQFRSMSEDDAIEMLASICSATPEVRPQLRLLIDFSEVSGILVRANGQLSAPLPGSSESNAPPPEPTAAPVAEARPPAAAPIARPAPSAAPSNDGGVNFNIDVQISMAEMKDWSADRITALFTGIAQVLAAKHREG